MQTGKLALALVEGELLGDKVPILGTYWSGNSRGNIGVVITKFEGEKDQQAFISIVDGVDPNYDAQFVAKWGSRFPLDIAKQLCGSMYATEL